LLALGTGAVALGFATSAEAANTYTVSGTADSASGSCSPSFVCTDLRAAIAAADAEPGSTIDLGAATYQLGGGHGVVVGTGQLQISQDVTIQGAGPALTRIVQTDGLDRVIFISAGTVEISGVEITGGNVVGAAGASPGAEGALLTTGGGIDNEGLGALTLANDAIVENSVTGGAGAGNSGAGNGGVGGIAAGGGVFSKGALTLTNSTVSANIATSGAGGSTTGTGNGGSTHGGEGGGVFERGTLSVSGSTISANTAAVGIPGTSSGGGGSGTAGNAVAGGIVTQAAPASVLNSTLVGNIGITPSGPFAIAALATASSPTPLTLASDTFAENQAIGATTLISNVYNESNTFTIADTLFVAGTGAGVNCYLTGATVHDEGHNLEDDAGASCELSALSGDLVGVSPLLIPLAANGGPTETMALSQGSPAIDAGGQCLDITQAGSPPLASDQRGSPRGNPCDIGAFESQPPSASGVPSIVGSAVQGQSLTCVNATWLGDVPLAFSTQWLRDGVAIAGATSNAYVASAADVNQSVSCEITAVNIYGSQTAMSVGVVVRAMPAASSLPSVAPATITGAFQTHSVWREGRALPQLSRVSKHKPPVGTTFGFTLNETASVSFGFTQSLAGRKTGGRCVRQTRANRHRKRCSRTLTIGTLTLTGHAGTNRLAFAGRVSSTHKLKPGRYTLLITATNAAGAKSAPAKLSFRIARA
jgi:hypothetical protein